jgi:DNA-binding NarL/FixJ family response regulator
MSETTVVIDAGQSSDGDFMTDLGAASPTLMIAILSRHYLVWYGLQRILERSATVPMMVHPHQWRTLNRLLVESRPDVVILDLEPKRDVIGTITQIRESASTSKIVLLCGLEDQGRAREAFACGVDGIILKVQPPTVLLAVIEALYAPAQSQTHVKRNGTGGWASGLPSPRRSKPTPSRRRGPRT